VLLTRAPLYSPPEGSFRVRLACLRHAASVDSEPGSNSRLNSSGIITILLVLKYQYPVMTLHASASVEASRPLKVFNFRTRSIWFSKIASIYRSRHRLNALASKKLYYRNMYILSSAFFSFSKLFFDNETAVRLLRTPLQSGVRTERVSALWIGMSNAVFQAKGEFSHSRSSCQAQPNNFLTFFAGQPTRPVA
jgi:hypothetical protein